MATPIGKPGAMTAMERYLFDVTGYLVIPDALNRDEVEACLAAAKRVHAPHPQDQWRQLGAVYEKEPAVENLIDHPSVFKKVRDIYGDYFILQSSWCTVSPPGFGGGGYHQDGSGPYEFRRLAERTPLVQLRIGFFLTDQTNTNMGNMVLIPGSHNTPSVLPNRSEFDDLPIKDIICGKPGTALMFHQGVFHCGTKNEMDYHRYIQHMVYAPPWLVPSDRTHNDPAFLERTTPLRRALLGEWKRPDEPFGAGYQRPPFED